MLRPLMSEAATVPGKTNTAADALSQSPLMRDVVIEVPRFVDASFLGDVDLSEPQQFFFQPSFVAPLASEPMLDWWQDYLNDPTLRKKYFIENTELLKDTRSFHNQHIWEHDRIIVPKARTKEIIAM